MLLALRSLWDTTAVTTTLRPGRVYKSQYPYFKPRKKPYWETDDDFDKEEEELTALMDIDI